MFEYEKLAELFDGVAGDLKAIDTNLVLIASANAGSPLYTNCRLEHGIALDVIGRGRNFTHVQMYGRVPVDYGGHGAMARRMLGQFPHAALSSSIQSLEFRNRSPSFPIEFYGYLLPHILHGATRVDLYRLNYVSGENESGETWWPRIRQGIRMMRLLDQWGAVDSASSAETCLLFSRASEDWWQVRAQARMGAATTNDARSMLLYSESAETLATTQTDARARALDVERFRGFYAGKCMESLLIENGIQYDFRVLERPDTLEGLERFKLLVLPFAYALSPEAFARIRSAVERGSQLLIYDQLGPVDAFGNAHPRPLLKDLIGRANVAYVPVNLAVEGTRRSVRDDARRMFRERLGRGRTFNRNGARVEVLERRTGGGMLLYLANWEPRASAMPVLGLAMPDGVYRMDVYSSESDRLTQGRLDGTPELTAAALRRFEVPLAPGEVKLLRLERRP